MKIDDLLLILNEIKKDNGNIDVSITLADYYDGETWQATSAVVKPKYDFKNSKLGTDKMVVFE